ncbi:hypothetical protein L484_024536 [Morus notabilis]|uniref:Uncharacterized protein n=1 Tax=Morus notabilis TaxID=981085 RepID=W9S6T5_9ROSA|nr:hypothetical protein L484_024536 [Morus notabilis]
MIRRTSITTIIGPSLTDDQCYAQTFDKDTFLLPIRHPTTMDPSHQGLPLPTKPQICHIQLSPAPTVMPSHGARRRYSLRVSTLPHPRS